MDLDLRRLRHFLAVADTLNFGRAAETLHLAQPALSRSVAALERELGVKLFDRSRAGTSLTPAGKLLHDEARVLLRSTDALQRRLVVAAREGRGVTIGFRPGSVVTAMVRHLEQRFPGLAVTTVPTSEADQIAGLRDGRLDASLALRPFNEQGLTVVELTDHMCLVVEAGRDSPVLRELVRNAHAIGDYCGAPPKIGGAV
ncbi:LysR family transcriptional regulator [Paractinoplanes lichenicola]|uniref:LysR family transcriptional regulator n=1 Tax=Paractinoplanes lichenicola TaxID=2802976 RepID=UPI0027DC1BA6|nr:LysR family transcriptional regulator [Actinoplanes lichenicola]